MKNIVNIQLSVLGNYNDFNADYEKIVKVGSIFGTSVLPTTIPNKNVNFDSGEVTTQQRLFIANIKDNINIVCLPERIDFNLDNSNGSSKMYRMTDDEFYSFVKFGCENLKKMLDGFNLVGNRLALNVFLVSEGIDNNKLNNVLRMNKFVLPSFADKQFEEFFLRYNFQNQFDASVGREVSNELFDVNLVRNIQASEKRIAFHFDLNTTQFNTLNRFNHNSIEEIFLIFSTRVHDLYSEFIQEVLR